jgi:ParB family chromosome partitioning protein
MLQPIVVSPLESGKYAIVAGERRWRAAQRAGLERVPVMVRAVEGPRQSLELALIENLQRTDLDPIEEAEAYRALIDHFELAHDQIAARVGKSRAAVSNALRLLKLPASVQELLRAGRLTAGQARALLALGDDEAIERLAERAAREGLSARALEALATSPAKRRRARLPLEPNAAAAAERLTQRLQTRVEIDRRGRGGVLRIHFHSEEELMRIYDLIAGAARR